MSLEWKRLWTAAGRDHISHWMIRTSNYAEIEFRQTKGKGGPVMDGAAIADPVVFIRLLVGLPTDPDSIRSSYFMSRAIDIAHIMSGNTNMHVPDRVFITPMKKNIAEIRALSCAVLDVATMEGVLYDVADASVRCKLRAGVGSNTADGGTTGAVGVDGLRKGYYRINIFHGCPCKSTCFFCKHLLSVRIHHLSMKRPRCWRDTELAPYFQEFGDTGMSVADLFASPDADVVLVQPTEDDVNILTQTQMRVLRAKTLFLDNALRSLSQVEFQPLPRGAPPDIIAAGAARARALGRLAEGVDSMVTRAQHLLGIQKVSASSKRQSPPSARSTEEVNARPQTSLGFAGSIGDASAAKGVSFIKTIATLSTAAPTMADDMTQKRKREEKRVAVEQRLQLSSNTELRSMITDLQRRLASALSTSARLRLPAAAAVVGCTQTIHANDCDAPSMPTEGMAAAACNIAPIVSVSAATSRQDVTTQSQLEAQLASNLALRAEKYALEKKVGVLRKCATVLTSRVEALTAENGILQESAMEAFATAYRDVADRLRHVSSRWYGDNDAIQAALSRVADRMAKISAAELKHVVERRLL